MIITMVERENSSAERTAEIIRRNEGHFMPEGKKRRVALGVLRSGKLEVVEVLPGENGIMEPYIPLDDLLLSLPEKIRAEILSAR